MTPGSLRRALQARDIAWPSDLAELPALVETRANAHPGRSDWTSLLLAVELFRTANVPLPAGYRRDRLVRFDSLSATWTAHDADGARYLIRAPRSAASAVHRRLLLRDGRALHGLVDHTVLDGALVAPALGAPFEGAPIGAIAVLASGLGAIGAWLERGFAPPTPDPAEVRVLDGRVRLVCLTPGTADLRGWLLPMVHTLRPLEPGPQTPLLDGLLTLPPTTLAEAHERVLHAMHAHLAERAVDLRTRYLAAGTTDRRQRLIDAIQRLGRALPAPQGEGRVGFDLDARPTRVVSDSEGIRFGTEGEETPIYTGVFDPPAARRFLRACAGAPVHNSPGFAEPMSRWVSGGLRLRTMRLLLERT